MKNAENIEVSYSFVSTIFNYGGIDLYCYGGAISISYVNDPKKIYKLLDAEIKLLKEAKHKKSVT